MGSLEDLTSFLVEEIAIEGEAGEPFSLSSSLSSSSRRNKSLQLNSLWTGVRATNNWATLAGPPSLLRVKRPVLGFEAAYDLATACIHFESNEADV